MNGKVDGSGRAILLLQVKPAAQASAMPIETWIDTGFTGELVLPQQMISAVGLSLSGWVPAHLADGSAVVLKTFTCVIDWFGKQRQCEVIAGSGHFPLLGIELLK